MNENTQAAIRDHAVQQFPRESCGLIVIKGGKETYLPCRNIAATPQEHFILEPEDFANAEELGEIVGVVHSHPNVPAKPSEADLVMCEATKLPWHIVHVSKSDAGNLQATEIYSFEPKGYVAPLVGRVFSHGILDCYAAVKDFYSREYGIELPDFERRDNWWNDGQNLYMDNFEKAGFAPIKGPIKVGDVIIMQIRAKKPNHAGVYIGNGQIFHHMANRLSSRDVYSGYFQENTRVIVRYKDELA